VSLDAQNVPVRQILAEWARIGGSTVINGDKVAGAPVTLQFDGVPERQALDIILRSVSGYMLAAREPGSEGLSGFSRILILPTSAGPRNAPAPAAAANPFGQPGMAGGQPRVGRPIPGMQMPPVQVEDDLTDDPDDPEEELADDDLDEPPVVFPRPGGVPRRPNVFPTPTPVPGMPPPQPMPPQIPGEGGQPGQPVTVSPGNPFGIPAGSAGTPGTVTPVPQPTRPSR
jgi:hypothetical protein